MSDVGARVARARRAIGITQAGLAASIGMERTALAKVERGRRRLYAEELASIAKALRRPADWFLRPDRDLSVLLRAERENILLIAKRHGASNVRVFGSIARGEATPDSDVDLLVEMQEGRSLFDLGALTYELEELLACDVDVATEEALRPRLRERVLSEAVAL